MELDKDLPFETLLKLEQQLGSKTFREVHGRNNKNSADKNEIKTLLPKNRNQRQDDSDEAPEEFSSKKPPKRSFAKLSQTPKPAPSIDPRFNPRAGEYKASHFRRNFQFAFDLKDKELETLKKSTPTNKNPEEKEKAKYLIQRLENQKREQDRKKPRAKPVLTKSGAKYFPSKKEALAQELVSKYVELKTSGKLQTHLEKRRKKQAGKERKRMDIEKT